MPLSRHFYALDEVQSSLLYSLSCGRVEESLFWCKELIDSGCSTEITSILFQSWLWNIGPYYMKWLINSYKLLSNEELSETDILNTTYHLASIPHKYHDNSLWNILITTIQSSTIPDKIVRKLPNNWTSNNNVETYFIGAIYQGKAQSAWWISRFIDDNRVYELLEWMINNVYINYKTEYNEYLHIMRNYESLIGFTSKGFDIIVQCSAIMGLCINDANKQLSFDNKWIKEIEPRLLQNITIWTDNLGRKTRRVYNIQKSSLYGNTKRGTLKWSENTLDQLNDAEKHLIGCPFWDEVIVEFGRINKKTKTIKWNNDECMEAFYDKYFPDDIPDEWSKEEKSKSHGDGVLGPSDIVNIWKYSRNNFYGKCRLAWETPRIVSKILEDFKMTISNCITHEFIENLYQSHENNELSLKDLENYKPVHKVLHIAGKK
jgi:hypothetical protein